MFDVWSAVQWWDEWQLRILVLGSLCLQWFLLLAAPMRKYTVPHWFRTCIWLAYISSDALAIYALATLFNRHAKATTSSAYGAGGTGSNASPLEVLWAPVLLIHLGGQEELTAYNIEDNELWTRHAVTVVSQVTVALYAFCKSWPSSSDWRLLASSILLFIIGVLSFCEKPLAFKKASINRLAAVSAVIQGTKKPTRDFLLSDRLSILEEETPTLSDGDKVYMILSDMSLSAAADDLVSRGKANSVEDVLRPPGLKANQNIRRWLRRAFIIIYTRANVHLSCTVPYVVYHGLVVPALHIAAFTLFAMSDKHPYNYTDVKTTYVLLSFTAALDVLAVFIRQLLYLAMYMASVPALCETMPGYNLIDAVLRRSHKDIGYSLMECATSIGIINEEYFDCKKRDENCRVYRQFSDFIITELVQTYGCDLASYRIFTESYAPTPSTSQQQLQHAAEACGPDTEITRSSPDHNGRPPATNNEQQLQHAAEACGGPAGTEKSRSSSPPHGLWSSDNWILRKELQKECSPEIRRSLRRSFDTSVLLWHIATDICFRMRADNRWQPDSPSSGRWRRTTGGISSETDDDKGFRDLWLRMECAEAISNYMAHLLNFHPEMLLTGSRQHLVTDAMDEMEPLLEGVKNSKPSRDDLRKMMMSTKKAPNELLDHCCWRIATNKKEVSNFQIDEACKLAKELLALTEEIRWEVMYNVWVGMLCYSASMCRGYLHAKSLGEGGEFLSFVWLVLSFRGAKTLADKLQMPPEPGNQEDKEEAQEASSSTPKPKPKKNIKNLR